MAACERGIRFFPVVGWAERGGYNATGHGNSVPRFHITWGTGTGIVAPFVDARARRRGGGTSSSGFATASTS